MEKKTKPRETWVKTRHKVAFKVFYPVIWLLCKLLYGIKIEKHKEHRQWLILFNHQTPFDQFFPCLMFHGPIYFVSTEDIISNGWISRLLTYLVAPIPIKKQMTDLKAVRNCLQVVREGGSIGMAPEGNRTYDGRTCYINPAAAKMAKKMGLPIALVRFEGGYALEPRWSDKRRTTARKPWMEAKLVEVIEPEELKTMSAEDLMDRVEKGLGQDDVTYVKETGKHYDSPHAAEYVERALYVCPSCGLTTFRSEGRSFMCRECNSVWTMLPDLTIERTSGETNGFPTMAEWFEHQQDYVRHLDLQALPEDPVYEDHGRFSHVILYQQKEVISKDATIRLFKDRVLVQYGSEEMVFPFEKMEAASVLGRNKLNLYMDREVYQVKGGPRFGALKYVNFYYRFKNMEKGIEDEQFLGL